MPQCTINDGNKVFNTAYYSNWQAVRYDVPLDMLFDIISHNIGTIHGWM